jgi:triacylglycerol lipase
MIIPPKSSQLPFGKEFVFPVSLHPLMLKDKRILSTVVAALQEPVNSNQ